MTNKIPFKCLQRYLQKSELYPSVNTNSLLHYEKPCYLKTVLFLRIWFDLILEGSKFYKFSSKNLLTLSESSSSTIYKNNKFFRLNK
jgi:hypothetical protein